MSSDSKVIHLICDEFDRAWQDQQTSKLNEFINRVDEQQRIELAKELISIDLEYRRRNNVAVSAEDYAKFGVHALSHAHWVLAQAREDSTLADTGQVVAKVRQKEMGPYRLVQKIGVGGMGEVWSAEQIEPVRREVAIKFIKSDLASKEIIARFNAERQALALMNHPNIAKVLDAGETEDGNPYFVMELVKGAKVTTYCDENRLSVAERLRLMVPVCKAIQHAHQKGVLHRDLKPSNILVELQDGIPVPKVIDFGLAKAIEHKVSLTEKSIYTEFGRVVGTLQYMSPEQAEMNQLDVDTRTDIYSLGVVLYELITGSTPLERKAVEQAALLSVLEKIRDGDTPRPSERLSSSGNLLNGISHQRKIAPARLQSILKGELDWVVMKALAKDRSQRYETASGLAADLVHYLNDEPVIARPPSRLYRFKKFVKKNRGFVSAAALISILLVGGILGTSYGLLKERTARKLANQKSELATRKTEDAIRESARANKEAERAREAERGAERNAQLAEDAAQRSRDILQIFTNSFESVSPKQGADANTPAKEVLFTAKNALENSKLEDIGRMKLLDLLAKLFFEYGENAQAVELVEKSLALHKQIDGPAHRETLSLMSNLASVYMKLARFEEGVALLEEVYEQQKETIGATEKSTLNTLNNLASAYHFVGRYQEAFEGFDKAYTLRLEKFGPDHPATLDSLGNLAYGYEAIGQVEKSLELRQHRLTKLKAQLPADDPDVLNAMSDVSNSLSHFGHHERALKLRKETLELQKKKLGVDHPNTVRNLASIASSMENLGQLEESLKVRQRVLEIQKSKLDRNHPDIATAMGALAKSYLKTGNLEKGIELAEETYEKLLSIYGPLHDDCLIAMAVLSNAYVAKGDIEKAIELSETRLTRCQKIFSAGHPSIANAKIGLGTLLSNSSQQYARALRLFDEAAKSLTRSMGQDFSSVAIANENIEVTLGRCKEKLKELRELDEDGTSEDIASLMTAIRQHCGPHGKLAEAIAAEFEQQKDE